MYPPDDAVYASSFDDDGDDANDGGAKHAWLHMDSKNQHRWTEGYDEGRVHGRCSAHSSIR